MKEFRFEKRCSAPLLTFELQQAGFKVIGVSTEDTSTIVYLEDEETKDPTPIVLAHDPEKPLNLALQMAEEMKTVWYSYRDKILTIANFLGIELTEPQPTDPFYMFVLPTYTPEDIVQHWWHNYRLNEMACDKLIDFVKEKMSTLKSQNK